MKPLSPTKRRLTVLCSLFVAGLCLQATEDITLKNGTILENAEVKGESPKIVIIEHEGKVESFDRALVPEKYLDAELTWPEEPVVEKPTIEADVNEPFAPAATKPVPEAPLQEPAPSTLKLEDFDKYIRNFEDRTTEEIQDILAVYQSISQRSISQEMWLVYILAIAAGLALGSLFVALIYSLFTWVFRVRFRSYGANYKVIFFTSLLNVPLFFLLMVKFPEILLWPWSLTIGAVSVGCLVAASIYEETAFRACLAYISMNLMGLASGVFLANIQI